MENNNQHIKNFFLFLLQKERRDIPIHMRLTYFPEDITEDDIYEVKHIKNDYGDESLPIARAMIYNKEQNRLNFVTVQEFNKIFDGLAVAHYEDEKPNYGIYQQGIFINFNGEPSIEGIEKISNRYFESYIETIFALNTVWVIIKTENELADLQKIYEFVNNIPSAYKFQGDDIRKSRTSLLDTIRKKIDKIKNS